MKRSEDMGRMDIVEMVRKFRDGTFFRMSAGGNCDRGGLGCTLHPPSLWKYKIKMYKYLN